MVLARGLCMNAKQPAADRRSGRCSTRAVTIAKDPTSGEVVTHPIVIAHPDTGSPWARLLPVPPLKTRCGGRLNLKDGCRYPVDSWSSK
jgi:hypothetical protein